MIQYYKFSAVCVLFVSLGCGDPDTSILELVRIEPIVNPNVGRLISEQKPFYPFMIQGQELMGVSSSGNLFWTKDDLQTFYLSNEGYFTSFSSFPMFGRNNEIFILTIKPFSYKIEFLITRDFGGTWNDQFYPITTGLSLETYPDRLSIVKSQFAFIVYEDTKGNFNRRVFFEAFNPLTGLKYRTKIHEGFGSPSLCFWDENLGAISMTVTDSEIGTLGKRYIIFTDDGGITWSVPIMLEDSNAKVLMTPSGRAIISGSRMSYLQGRAFFKDLTREFDNRRISNVNFFDSNTGMAFSDRMFYLTKDGGFTWSYQGKAKDDMVGSLFQFASQNDGIFYGNNTLYSTHDGGATWKTLVYPYGTRAIQIRFSKFLFA